MLAFDLSNFTYICEDSKPGTITTGCLIVDALIIKTIIALNKQKTIMNNMFEDKAFTAQFFKLCSYHLLKLRK